MNNESNLSCCQRTVVNRSLQRFQNYPVPESRANRHIFRDEMLCEHCGACVAQCSSGAITQKGASLLVFFDDGLCCGCSLCVIACPYCALSLGEDRGGH